MNELISNPAFQSGVLPFFLALLVTWALRPLGWYWAGLGFAVAYYASAYLVVGFQFTPLTSTRKLLLLGLVALFVGGLIDLFLSRRRYALGLMALLAVAAVVWLIWPVLKRKEDSELLFLLIPAIAYSGWLVVLQGRLRTQGSAAAISATAMGIGVGGCALLGASALLGQLGLAIGFAASAVVLLVLRYPGLRLGSLFSLPTALLSALVGVAATVYAKQPDYALLPIALIPLLARIPLSQSLSPFKRTALLAAFTFPLAGLAIVLTWQSAAGGASVY